MNPVKTRSFPLRSLQIFSSYLPSSADWSFLSPSQVPAAVRFRCCAENRRTRESDKRARAIFAVSCKRAIKHSHASACLADLGREEGRRTDSSRLSGVPQLRSGWTSPCPACCRLPFSGVEMKEAPGTGTGRETGPNPELEGGKTTATAGGGIVRLAGNQPTVSVLWFWPLHSDISRLARPTEQ